MTNYSQIMKPFEQTIFFKWVSPLVYRIIPAHSGQRFWCLFIVSSLLVQVINIVCWFWNGFLGSPADDTPGYYALIVVETVRYGAWLWGFWYCFYQLVKLSPRNQLLTPQLLSCSVTSGLLMYLLTAVTQHVEPDYILLIRGMLIFAFGAGVVLPTIWHPASSIK